MNDIVTWVTAYKDNPGVLMWDVGNESLLGLGNCYSGAELEAQRAAYATFVNDAAKRIHQIDPSHPVTSTDAWTGAWPYFKANAPDLDLYGLNSYGAICDAKETWINGGYTKPYLITEGGPAGEWEVPNDVNGVPDQGTDQQNADGYTTGVELHRRAPGRRARRHDVPLRQRGRLRRHLVQHQAGQQQAPVATTRSPRPTAARPRAATTRRRSSAAMTVADQTGVVAGANVSVTAPATDPNGDAITYNVLVNSNYINKSGGLPQAPFTRNGSTFTVTAPQTLGVWKVYVFAEDGKGNVGVETRSFRVVPPAVAGTNIAKGKTATASSFDPYNGNFTPGRPSTATSPPAGRAAGPTTSGSRSTSARRRRSARPARLGVRVRQGLPDPDVRTTAPPGPPRRRSPTATATSTR